MRLILAPVLSAAALAVLLLVSLPPAAVAAPAAADLTETFAADPRANASWALTGTFAWSGTTGALNSPKAGTASAQWVPGWYYAGTLVTRFKLVSWPVGTRPGATVVFAADPATGASRWVRITAGAPGTVALGQTGTIGGSGPRTIKAVRTAVPTMTWIDLSLTVARDGNVTVKLGATPLFTAAAAPLAAGRIGFATTKTRASFTTLSFRNDPNAEPCQDCHAGQAEASPAPDVYRYWDGSWWDANMGGSDMAQQGGHGDPDGRAAATCTGTTGCHDLRLPKPGDHRNGVLEPAAGATKNTYHLQAGFIDATPARDGDVQLTFDDNCYATCHKAAGVADHRHRLEPIRPTPDFRFYVEFGQKRSDPTASAVPSDYVLDHEISTAANPGIPVFAPCVACHDPHGSGTNDSTKNSNHMMRRGWSLTYQPFNELCIPCHNI